MKLFLALISLVTIKLVQMVKQQDFKLCSQSGFCTRQRAFADLNPRQSPYQLISLSVLESSLSANVINIESNITFALSIELYEMDTLRIRMVEKQPFRPRHVADSSANTLQSAAWRLQNDSQLEWGGNVLSIHRNPFTIAISHDNVNVFEFNARHLLNFEHYREKPVAAELEDVKEEIETPADSTDNLLPVEQQAESEIPITDAQAAAKRLQERLVQGEWEEKFGSSTDSKINGMQYYFIKTKGPSSIGIDISFPGSQHLYGLPQHASSFNLKSTRGDNAQYEEPFRLYNFDVFEYIMDSPMALYGAIPFLMSHKVNHSVGVLWLNYAEMWVDVERTQEESMVHWTAESGIIDLFVSLGKTPRAISSALSAITGKPAMPQLFAISYHQCRWNYNDEADVFQVDAGFDKHDIPYDALWLDIEHTDGKKYFTWDTSKFPDPLTMQRELFKRGRRMVTIVDPHIKKDDSYHIAKEAQSLDIFVKGADGKDFEGWCWPGNSQWLDYTNPAARKYWAERFQYHIYAGSSPSLYTWNDMNEPSVFSGPEITMPKDAIHYAGWEHRDIHNVYGMLQHQSTFEGHLLRSERNDRPFILSRAFFAGTQQYGAIWTGDNFATWEHMQASIPMILSISIAGVVFSGADVGGFFGNPDAELLVRWYQLGAYQPFFRAHAHIDTKRREPWLYGPDNLVLIRDAIRARYRILPYLYTLNLEAHLFGWPIMRAMMFCFPMDVDTFSMDDQFMLGEALLVKAVGQNAVSVDVYLPEGRWYDYDTYERIKDGPGYHAVATPMSKIPVMLRGGSILPRRDRIRRASSLMHGDPYTLLIALDSQGYAKGSVYADDGQSYSNANNGEYLYSEFCFRDARLTSKAVTIAEWGASGGAIVEDMQKEFGGRVERIILLGFEGLLESVWVLQDGRQLDITASTHGSYVVKDPRLWIGEAWDIEFIRSK